MIQLTHKITGLLLLAVVVASQIVSVKSLAQTKAESEKLIKKSWAIRNTGQDQLFDLNPLQTYRLQGRKGEDLNLASAVLSPVATRKVKVAVLDTGVDTKHPYLRSRIAYNQKECAILKKYQACVNGDTDKIDECMTQYMVAGQNGVDEDGNGYPADCHGWSIYAQKNTPDNIIGTPDFGDTMGHGTHVAGLVASVSDNIEIISVQVIAEGPNQPVKPFSVDLSPSENGGRNGLNPSKEFDTAEHVARGIIYAMNAGAEVITMSIGWPQLNDTELMRAAVAEAQARGIIIVAAAGNDSTQALLRPCQYKGVICVAASRPDGSIAQFSNYGYGVDIAAPGVSLVSTIPTNRRAIRLPLTPGLDILSGTSQATPLVAGVIADMLARGIPASEIYPRLILGARAVKSEMPIVEGSLQTVRKLIKPPRKYDRYVLSGLIDQTKSLAVTAQALILNADKETHVINWDRKSSELTFQFNLVNYWQDITTADVGITMMAKSQLAIYPTVESVEILNPDNDDMWEMGEERVVEVRLKINDNVDASLSQIPSELTFVATTTVAGQKNMSFDVKAEILLQLNKEVLGSDMISLPITGKLERGFNLYLVDEVYDKKISERDYIASKRGEKSFDVQLVKYKNKSYTFGEVKTLPFSGTPEKSRLHQRIRMDVDFDGKSDYVLVVQEFKENEGLRNNGDYTMHFYFLDDQLNLRKNFSFYDLRSVMPLNYSWLRVGNELRPAWISNGKKVIKKWDILDLMGTDDASEPKQSEDDIRLYYLDQDLKLATIESGAADTRIVDIIQTSLSQTQSGVLPVLLARNLGTEIKPGQSEFSVAYIKNLQLTHKKVISNLSKSNNYRNLVDTNVDKVLNLKASEDEYRGAYWFGQDTHSRMRVTMIDFTNGRIHDKLLRAQNEIYDAPLTARAAFIGKKTQGAFVVTNAEIEYHDFKTAAAAQTSLNKYTFMGQDILTAVQYPITISKRGAGTKYPALFNSEGTLNKAFRVMMPIFNEKGQPQEIITPARFRLQAPQGCRALSAPVYLGGDINWGGYSMDYYCGDRILRVRLVY